MLKVQRARKVFSRDKYSKKFKVLNLEILRVYFGQQWFFADNLKNSLYFNPSLMLLQTH